MEWIKTLNSAIDYIEDNLLCNLSCEDISNHVYISTFHFQRTFNLLTGMTLGEYIRNRRLSLAGEELVSTDESYQHCTKIRI
ncbi:helix-turn-helix domain-containing protein [Clostridium senegalense]